MATLSSVTHIPVLNIQHLFKPYTTFYITNLLLYLHLFNSTFSIPITPSDTENYLPSDDPNITNLMVSHYECAKQHNLRQFNLLNINNALKLLPTLNMPVLKPVYMSEQKLNVSKLSNVLLMQRRKGKYAFKVP